MELIPLDAFAWCFRPAGRRTWLFSQVCDFVLMPVLQKNSESGQYLTYQRDSPGGQSLTMGDQGDFFSVQQEGDKVVISPTESNDKCISAQVRPFSLCTNKPISKWPGPVVLRARRQLWSVDPSATSA